MRRVWTWFFLSCKRYLHRLSFLVILLLLPVGAFLIRGLERSEGTEIRIAVCVEGKDNGIVGQGETVGLSGEDASERGISGQEAGVPLEWQLLNDLVSREQGDGLFRFYACDTEEEVRDEVASRRAECGYVIASGLREKLDAKKYKRSIRIYSAPSTVTAELSAEVVFAALIRRYDRELFVQYVEQGEAFSALAETVDEETLRRESGALYDKWMKDGGTFRFVYSQAGENALRGQTAEPDGLSRHEMDGGGKAVETRLFPVRGIVSVYVFVIGLYGAAIGLADEKRGLYHMLPASGRVPCQLASILGPVALAAVSGLAALACGGVFAGGLRELLAMAAYGLAVTGFSWTLGRVCRREAVVCCLIPFFLTASLIFCPVIVDVERYVPAIQAVGRCFLPWYYLRLF